MLIRDKKLLILITLVNHSHMRNASSSEISKLGQGDECYNAMYNNTHVRLYRV
jgi:hypothetical protein